MIWRGIEIIVLVILYDIFYIKQIITGKALRDISRAARKGETSGLGLQPANRNMIGLMGGGDRSEKKTRGKGF